MRRKMPKYRIGDKLFFCRLEPSIATYAYWVEINGIEAYRGCSIFYSASADTIPMVEKFLFKRKADCLEAIRKEAKTAKNAFEKNFYSKLYKIVEFRWKERHNMIGTGGKYDL